MLSFFFVIFIKYGEVFSFTMVGQTFTYLIGTDSSSLLFNSKNDVLNAEEVYGNLTAPVVGEGVGYGVENAVSKTHIFVRLNSSPFLSIQTIQIRILTKFI